jgi:hypothetical protein
MSDYLPVRSSFHKSASFDGCKRFEYRNKLKIFAFLCSAPGYGKEQFFKGLQ